MFGLLSIAFSVQAAENALELCRFRLSQALNIRICCTAMHPMTRLPSATIQRIARYLPLMQRITFSQTSQYIRSSLRSMPDLWSQVDYRYRDFGLHARNDDKRIACAAQGVLSLSCGSTIPVSLRMHISPFHMESTAHAAFIAANLAHLSTFDLSLSGYALQTTVVPATVLATWKWIEDMVCFPAPRLRRFVLRPLFMSRFSGLMEELPRLPEHLLDEIPGLEQLSLFGMILRTDIVYPALAGLVTLEYFQSLHPLTSKDICALLSNLPALEHLGLTLGHLVPEPDEAEPMQLPAHRLKSAGFFLEHSSNDQQWSKRKRIVELFDEVPTVRVRFSAFLGLEGAYSMLPAAVDLHMTGGVRETEISSSGHGAPNCRMSLHFPPTRIPWQSEVTDDPSVVPLSQANRLVSLSVHESVFANVLTSLPSTLPELLVLRVALATCADYSRHDERNNPSAPWHAILHPMNRREEVQFPSLQEVHFLSGPPPPADLGMTPASPCWFRQILSDSRGETGRSCWCTNPPVVALYDLCDLIKRILAPGQRIHRLLVAGIGQYVDIDLSASLREVSQVAERLELEDTAPVEVLEACRQSHYGNVNFGIPMGPDAAREEAQLDWDSNQILPGMLFR